MELPKDDDLVLVPASPNANRDGLNVETRRLAVGGAGVGLAFTTLDALVAELGDGQPWIAIPMVHYVRFLRDSGIVHVQVDPLHEADMLGRA